MSHYGDGRDLEQELVAFLEGFFASGDGQAAIGRARELGESAVLVLRLDDPALVLSVDFFAGTVRTGPVDGADVEIEMDADALHDILLDRLDPVQTSRLYETDRVRFRGGSQHLAALILLAGPLAPHYAASLRRRGRTDLLETPLPPTKTAWGDPAEALSPREMIGKRRPWQRAKPAAA
jgi:hypothetical protein